MMTTYEAVRAVAILMLAGVVLQAADVSAGIGKVIDWRTVPSGATVLEGADAFDTAALFVALVGPEAAIAAVAEAIGEEPEAPPPVVVAPRVHAYAPGPDGERRRSFDVDPFTVLVEPHEDDAAQADFTARLAAVAASLIT